MFLKHQETNITFEKKHVFKIRPRYFLQTSFRPQHRLRVIKKKQK